MSNPADQIIANYERHASSWDTDRRAAGWNDKCWIDRFIGLLPTNATVLDLGCGGGLPVAVSMFAHRLQVTGVDTSPTLISLCRSRMPDQEWIVADMRSLALGRQFDGILAWDSFFHLRPDDQRAMFQVFVAHATSDSILCSMPAWLMARLSGHTEAGRFITQASMQASMRDCYRRSDSRSWSIRSMIPKKGGRIVWIAREAFGGASVQLR